MAAAARGAAMLPRLVAALLAVHNLGKLRDPRGSPAALMKS